MALASEGLTMTEPEIVDVELPEWLQTIREERGVVVLEVRPAPNSLSTIELSVSAEGVDQLIEALSMFRRS